MSLGSALAGGYVCAVADREVVGRAVDRDLPEHVQVARIEAHHRVVDRVRHPDGPCPDGDARSAAAGRDVSRDPATRGVDAEEPVGELARDPDAAGADSTSLGAYGKRI